MGREIILWDVLTLLDGVEYVEIFERERSKNQTEFYKEQYTSEFAGSIFNVSFDLLICRLDRINITENDVFELYVSYE